mmetsp:Transcript_22996/g.39123  ORF Transcript_22996/g.39123 Transcript_22996/m.39123 type:complete len:341 (-) Transcript_22996:23-1045(-)
MESTNSTSTSTTTSTSNNNNTTNVAAAPAIESESSNDKSSSSIESVAAIVIGMAGAGKTSVIQRWNSELARKNKKGYMINLDPAVTGKLPFGASIDIRDSVDYKEVMNQYQLGPNGAIVTSLNLFASRFDQAIGFVEKKVNQVDHIVIDTPGQIEVFTWSASGTIITDMLAATLPTCVIFVVDTVRSKAPATFVANMMYACSVLYKTRLPLVLCFNKIDIVSHDFAKEWMTDFMAFQTAVAEEPGADSNYMSSFTQSMGLVLEEFYRTLECVGVSALTGLGFDDLFDAVKKSAQQYNKEYKPELERRRQLAQQRESKEHQEKVEIFKKELAKTRGLDSVL